MCVPVCMLVLTSMVLLRSRWCVVMSVTSIEANCGQVGMRSPQGWVRSITFTPTTSCTRDRGSSGPGENGVERLDKAALPLQPRLPGSLRLGEFGAAVDQQRQDAGGRRDRQLGLAAVPL